MARQTQSSKELERVFKNRIKNVRALRDQCGGTTAFCFEVRMSPAEFYHIAGDQPSRVISEKKADEIERAFKLPFGTLSK